MLHCDKNARHFNRCLPENVEGRRMSRCAERESAHRHGNGHVALRDSVHGAAHERRLESDVPGDAAFCHDFMRTEVNFARQEEEVVVGQASVDGRVHKLADGETIGSVVGLENSEGSRGCEEGFIGHGREGVGTVVGVRARVMLASSCNFCGRAGA